MSTAALFTITKTWKQPECLSKSKQINKKKICEASIQWNTQQYKGTNC